MVLLKKRERAQSLTEMAEPLLSTQGGIPIQLLLRLIHACQVFPPHMPNRLSLVEWFVFQNHEPSMEFAQPSGVSSLIPLVDHVLSAPTVGTVQDVARVERPSLQLDDTHLLFQSLRLPCLDALSQETMNRLLEVTPFPFSCAPVLLPLSRQCVNCNRNIYFKQAFKVMVYATGSYDHTRLSTSLVFRCQGCNIIFYHGFHRLGKCKEDDTRRYVYDTRHHLYRYFPTSPRTYVSMDWVQGMWARLTTRPTSMHLMMAEFNIRQGIIVPSSTTQKYARKCLSDENSAEQDGAQVFVFSVAAHNSY
jgi:hypothetical protein